MGLLPTVLISLVFPALMLFVTVALGRMEEILLPHLQAPRPAEGEKDSPDADSRDADSRDTDSTDADPGAGPGADKDTEAADRHAEEIRVAHARADMAKARAEALRRSARRRAYGTARPVGRTNTGPPRGARTTPLRFR